MLLYKSCSKQPSRAFRHAAVQNIFENTGGKVHVINLGVTV